MRTASSRGRPIGDSRPPIAGSATLDTRTDAEDARDIVDETNCEDAVHHTVGESLAFFVKINVLIEFLMV